MGSKDFRFGVGWRLKLDSSVPANDVAVETLRQVLQERFDVTLDAGASSSGMISLRIAPGSVQIGTAQDSNRDELEKQAYRIDLKPQSISIIANAPAGLFYGVETLAQLVKPKLGGLWLPEGEIVDWPDVGLREIFWDEQMHLDHFDVLKQAIRRAASFKINALALRLNEYFQYSSAPALVAPYALSPAQLQELTNYGLHYHLQVIPYLDGPAHVNFILEHQAYKHLREFPESAFEMCSTNPETYSLLEGMQQDLINATKGVQYFHLSTDEAWFIGKADNDQCHEAERAKVLGSPSKMWVEYTQKTASYLQARGRKVIFWGETPLQVGDIPLLPSGLINGEIYSPAYNRAFRAHGITQMIYTNSQPDDPLFPVNTVLAPQKEVHPQANENRQAQVFNEISFSSGRKDAEIIGAGVYAWGDDGPHPETFWQGYAVGAAAAWHPGSPDPGELAASFYRIFYGQGSTQMGRLYQLMSTQAQFFASSWDSKPSVALPLIFGYSYGTGPFVPHIQTLPLPPVPSGGYLDSGEKWLKGNSHRLNLAKASLEQNDELLDSLYSNLQTVQFHQYNLEVYLSIAKLCRHNLFLLKSLEQINSDFEKARNDATKLHYTEAIGEMDAAIDVAEQIRDNRNQTLQAVTATWYKTWFPRVRQANGRHVARDPQPFVDTATSEDARRRQEGLVYLIDREFLLPLGDWVNQVQDVRNRYATTHKLPVREVKFDWQDTTTLHSQASDREF
ncbi:MAG: glycoside hydrolase family 20 zincin-like fold domain-containing protein [Acidobacteriaceae bacterium]